MIADRYRRSIFSMVTDFHIRATMIPDGGSRGWRSASAGRVSAMRNRERTRVIRAAPGAVATTTARCSRLRDCGERDRESHSYERRLVQHFHSPTQN